METAFIGRLGRDPELRRVKGGELPLLNLSIAAGDDGDGDSPPEWVKVAVFGERAEALAGQLQRGARLYVEGRLKLERWEGRDGAPRAGLSVTATLVQPLGQIGRRKPARASQGGAELPAGPSPRPGPDRRAMGRQPATAGPATVDDGFDWERGDPLPFG